MWLQFSAGKAPVIVDEKLPNFHCGWLVKQL